MSMIPKRLSQTGSLAESQVFHQLRVESPADADDGNARVHFIYNGVSANSWLSSIGISSEVVKSKAVQGQPALADECKRTIHARARSASLVLGRRHFEMDQQVIGRSEVLRGTSALGVRPFETIGTSCDHFRGGRSSISSEVEPSMPFRHAVEVTRPQTCIAVRNTTEQVHRVNRPKTSIPDLRTNLKIPETQRCSSARPNPGSKPTIPDSKSKHSSSSEVKTCPDLKIKSMLQTQAKPTPITDPVVDESIPNQLGFMDVKLSSALLNDASIGFRSTDAMKEALVMRMRSARGRSPAPPLYEQQRHGHLVDDQDGDQQSTKTKAKNRFESTKHEYPRYSTRVPLKPLLYNEEFDIKHSSDCPYNCRGCFRACLASEDYINNSEPPEASKPRKPKHRQLKNPLLKSGNRALRTITKEYPEPELKFVLTTEKRIGEIVDTKLDEVLGDSVQ